MLRRSLFVLCSPHIWQFLQIRKPIAPHLSGAERVTPGDDGRTFFAVIRFSHGTEDLRMRFFRYPILDRIRQTFRHEVRHLPCAFLDGIENFLSASDFLPQTKKYTSFSCKPPPLTDFRLPLFPWRLHGKYQPPKQEVMLPHKNRPARGLLCFDMQKSCSFAHRHELRFPAARSFRLHASIIRTSRSAAFRPF